MGEEVREHAVGDDCQAEAEGQNGKRHPVARLGARQYRHGNRQDHQVEHRVEHREADGHPVLAVGGDDVVEVENPGQQEQAQGHGDGVEHETQP